jgi:hypothetical protein
MNPGSSGKLTLCLGTTLPQMLQRLLQGGDLTEPGPVLGLDESLGRVGCHLFDARRHTLS